MNIFLVFYSVFSCTEIFPCVIYSMLCIAIHVLSCMITTVFLIVLFPMVYIPVLFWVTFVILTILTFVLLQYFAVLYWLCWWARSPRGYLQPSSHLWHDVILNIWQLAIGYGLWYPVYQRQPCINYSTAEETWNWSKTHPVQQNHYIFLNSTIINCGLSCSIFWSILFHCHGFGKPFQVLHPNCF